MTNTAPVVTVSPRDYDAVLFDLDGVLTKTASVHAAAWKRLFDGFLEQHTADIGEPFVAFDIKADYRRYVDGKARAAARAAGYQGAMFPWQSGSDGQEETQELNLNPQSGRWVPDNTYLQRHVGSAIAWNVWQYFQVTYDIEFLQFYGAELILEIARFWSSIATFNGERGRYEIHGVMGPDEFHEGYPGSPTPGLNNNAYTNVMAELDWEGYRRRYGNIQRLELILEAENDSANRYKLSKQADALMLFYLFSAEELGELFRRLGYPFEYETIPRTVAYDDWRSSHGSTLSRVVHAWVLARSDRVRAMAYYAEALQSDVSDIQQRTTAEGVHLGAMAGTVDVVQRVSTGIEVTGDVLRLNPRLPQELARLDMRIRYRGHSLDLRLTSDTLTVRCREPGIAPIRLGFKDEVHEVPGGSTHVFKLGGAGT
jgi:trehalose/maltose hydrolase-like predicted phosphorylase